MKAKTMTDEEEVLDYVIDVLLERPHTNADIYAEFDYKIQQDAIDNALMVLDDVRALKVFREARQGSRVNVYAIKSEARTYVECPLCKGTGVTADSQRGLCQYCRGNGVYTPHGAFSNAA